MRSRAASEVLLDASVLCLFARAGHLPELRGYLGRRALMTREVERELLRLLKRPEFASLEDHLLRNGVVASIEGKWPKLTKPLPDHLKADFARLIHLKHRIGEHEWAHSGEIATVLMAEHRRSDLVIIDDDWGSDLASRTYGLAVMSTARLALEMVVLGALSEADGFRVFDSATPSEVGRERFDVALRRLKEAG